MSIPNPIESALFANSGVLKDEKYKIAWGNLLSDDHNIRANCKTWLTYRAIENEVTYRDWCQHVKNTPIDELSLSRRWRISVTTADCYLQVLNGNKDSAWDGMWFIHRFKYAGLEGMLPNFLRISCLLARGLVEKEHEVCKAVILRTIDEWQRCVASMDLLKEPSWPADGGFDVAPLHHLLRTAEMIGLTKFRPDQSGWIDNFSKGSNSKPWMQCLKALTRKDAAEEGADILTFVTVLKTGGEYHAGHVHRLLGQIEENYGSPFRFLCLTDDPAIDAAFAVPLVKGWRGWWSKVELFAHDFGRCCYLDLDITIRASITWIDAFSVGPGDFFAMEDAWWRDTINSSFMLWRGSRPALLAGFNLDTQPEMLASGQINSDQVWIDGRIGRRVYIKPPLVGSYKLHGKDSASIVVYHGKPKPWDVDGA